MRLGKKLRHRSHLQLRICLFSAGSDGFQLSGNWVINPLFAALVADERRNITNNDNPRFHINGEGRFAGLHFSATERAFGRNMFHIFVEGQFHIAKVLILAGLKK